MRRTALMLTIFLAAVWTSQSVAGNPSAEGDVQQRARGLMEKMDPNGDGQITLDEYRQAWQKRIEKRFQRLDTDGDGVLSQAEIAKIREKFARMRDRFREQRGEPLPE